MAKVSNSVKVNKLVTLIKARCLLLYNETNTVTRATGEDVKRYRVASRRLKLAMNKLEVTE